MCLYVRVCVNGCLCGLLCINFFLQSQCMSVFYLIPPGDLWEARENDRGKVGIMRQRNECEQGGIVL